jgi:ATP-dependent Clp protease ATP-binding subunit ClpB
LETTPEVLDWLAEEGFNPEFGARPLKRVIHKRILKELSKQMLLNKIQPKSHVQLDVFDDTVVFRQPKQVDEALAMGQ